MTKKVSKTGAKKGKKNLKEPVNKGGKPTVMTESVLSKLEQAFKIGCGDVEACLHAGICKATLYNYQKKNPEYVDQKEQWKENPVLIARNTVVSNMKNDPSLAWKYLEKKKSNEFKTGISKEIRGFADEESILGDL